MALSFGFIRTHSKNPNDLLLAWQKEDEHRYAWTYTTEGGISDYLVTQLTGSVVLKSNVKKEQDTSWDPPLAPQYDFEDLK